MFDICFYFRQNGTVLSRNIGFTLMELLIVVALIMILSVVSIGSYTLATTRSRDTRRKSELAQIVRALESFNSDVGRYPLSGTNNEVLCYIKEAGVVTNPACDGNKLTAVIEGETVNYITIPDDPDSSQRYIYISDGLSFGAYAALENTNDKDILKLDTGAPNLDPWGVSCGSAPCNYKLTEVGVARTNE